MRFQLHPNLIKKTFLLDLPLSKVLLEDEKNYPWLILVPRRFKKSKIMDLSSKDQIQLMHELDISQRVLWELFKPLQLNVASLGNKTPQLHIHVIARRLNDPAWPQTVWDHPLKKPYTLLKKKEMIEIILKKFAEFSHGKK